MCLFQMFEAYFEAQVLLLCGFRFFFEGEGGYTNSDEFLTHILK